MSDGKEVKLRWPWWVRLIDRLVGRALEQGWLSAEWIEEVIAEGSDGRVTRRRLETKGVEIDEPGGRDDGGWRARLAVRLVDSKGRHEICEALTLGVSLGTAAAAALRRAEVEGLPELLADAISAGEAEVAGALSLLGRIGEGDEVRTFAQTDRLLTALHDRNVDVWGFEELEEEQREDEDGGDGRS